MAAPLLSLVAWAEAATSVLPILPAVPKSKLSSRSMDLQCGQLMEEITLAAMDEKAAWSQDSGGSGRAFEEISSMS